MSIAPIITFKAGICDLDVRELSFPDPDWDSSMINSIIRMYSHLHCNFTDSFNPAL